MCGGLVATSSGGTAHVTKVLPDIADEGDPIIYCADTDAPDGWVQAMQCINHNATSGSNSIGPGFFSGTIYVADSLTPGGAVFIRHKFAASSYTVNSTRVSSSCLVYDANAAPDGFKDVGFSGTSQKLAQNTYSSTITAVAIKKVQQFGTSLIKLQNKETIRQAAFAWYDLVASDLKSSPMKSRSMRASKYKGKGKMKDEKDDKS
jgi:hypothetical protein